MANIIFRKNGTNYTIDGLIAGTGHIIKNSSGQEVNARQYLQFNGVYVSDDAVGDKTEVNIVRQMTKAAMDALSSAEQEGFIDTTDEDDNYIPISAEDVKYGNTDVDSALDDIYSRISGGSRTVTTLANDSGLSIVNQGSKTYSTLTTTAISAYDELMIMICFSSNVFITQSLTKAQISVIAGVLNNEVDINGLIGTSMAVYAAMNISANGLKFTNHDTTGAINITGIMIQGIKYNY